MLAIVRSATLIGVGGQPVTVEVHVAGGLPGFSIVGLPDASCREARDRVRAALLCSRKAWPATRVTVNLAPSGIRKVGAGLDLAIAVGLLVASGQLPSSALDAGYLGELGLDGTVRPVTGALPMVAAVDAPMVVVARGNETEAALVAGTDVRSVRSVGELVACVEGHEPWSRPAPVPAEPPGRVPDLAEVRGNRLARFALEVAAAGGHHLLFVGPPGGGKTMLAERLPGLLGDLPAERALEVSTIHSAAGQPLPTSGLIRRPPFRAPHHTVSQVALVGGGSHALRPGEASLASSGVLFLDELGEFSPHALDALRQPLEEGMVRVSRAHASATLPARFQLVAAMNPCPCGALGTGSCRCSEMGLARYRRRLSGPLLDRFDLRVLVRPTAAADLVRASRAESSAAVADRVAAARDRARARGIECNRELDGARLDDVAPLSGNAEQLLERAVTEGRLSGRGLRRVRTVALTLSDLRGQSPPVEVEAVAEALALRAELRFDGALDGAA